MHMAPSLPSHDTDVDECLLAGMRGLQLCPEEEVCVNSVGSYDCVCSPGQYRVTIDGVVYK